MSVSLEDYLIPPGVRRVSAPTASSTSRGTSIKAAPSARRSGSSSRRPNKDPRGDLQETAEAIHDPLYHQPGDSEGPRPSKPAAADDPATQGHSSRRLRSADATAATSATAANVERGHSSRRAEPSRADPQAESANRGVHTPPTEDEPSRADIQVAPANGGVQPPPSQQGVPSLLAPDLPSQSSTRGAPDPPIHGVPFLSAPALPRRRVSNPRTKHSNLLSVSDRLGRRGSGPPVQGAHSSESDPPTQGGTSSPLRLEADVSSVSDIDDGSSSTPPVQQEEHRCPHPRCNKTYKTMRDAVKHVNSTHKDQFRLPNGFARCPSPRCRQVFTRGGLSIHQRKKHPHLPLTPRNSDDEAQEDVPQPPQPFRGNDPSNLPSIETLHQFFTRETTWLSPKWKPLLQQLHLLLLQRTRATITSTSPNHSFSAYLLLPGFMETVRIANRLPGAKQLKIDSPITYLRAFIAVEPPEQVEEVIIGTMKTLYTRLYHSILNRRPSARNHNSRELSKIDALTQLGRISKAARLADHLERASDTESNAGNGVHITNERAASVLPDLFPMASDLDDLGERVHDEWDIGRALQVTAVEVATAITKLSIDRASGFSGWSNRLLKQLFLGSEPDHQQAIALAYADIFNAILKGQVSDQIRSYLTDVRLCLIPKSTDTVNPKYRPIGVGETMFRLLGRTILNKIGKNIGANIAPHQLAVGISGGVETAACLAGLLPTINETQPADDVAFATMSIDIKNAFNSIRRSFVLQGLRRHCPELIPFFSTVYGQTVNLRWNNGSIIGTASTGVIQGDPLSTLYFAIATQPLLLDIQAKLRSIETHDSQLPEYARPGIVFAIADDITIHARTPHLYQLSSDMQDVFHRYELPLNLSKSWIIGPQVHLHSEASRIACRHMHDGGRILGVPVGDLEFCLSWIREHFRENGPPLRTLSMLPAKTAVTLLKFSYNPRMDYLSKTAPERILNSSVFAEYDALVDDALLTTGIADSREELHTLRSLPSTCGGLGMPSLEGHHGARHHILTAMRTREFLKPYYSHFIRDHSIAFNSSDLDIDGTPPDGIADILYQLRASRPTDDALSLFREAMRKRSNDLDARASSAYHQRLIDGNSHAAAAVFLSAQGVKLSFVTYSCSHQLSTNTALSNKEYIEAMRFFLLSPFRMNLSGASLCRCGQANSCDLLLNPFHSSNCRLNSRERTFRHTAVCLLLSKLLRRASPTSRVTLEPRDASAAHHPDIAVEDNAILYHVDVSIVEPTSEHAMSANIAAATTKGAAAASKETAKIATYSGTDWANVIPFVLESTGHLGKAAEDLLEKITLERRPLRAWFLEELSTLLARTQGRMRLHSHALLR